MSHSYKTLEFEKRGGIGILTLNRPEKLNALSMELIGDLNNFFYEIKDDYQTRVLILRGAGRAFCAGADLNQSPMVAGAPKSLGEVQYAYHAVTQALANIILNMRRCSQPIIGAIHGAATGAGFSISLACDIRVLGQSTRFNAAFIRIGLSGCEMGTSYFLPRIIGLSKATEYLYTGRFIDAATADKLGLASRLVPDDEVDSTALEIAEEMLQNSPFGLRMTKEVLNINLNAASLESAIGLENRTQTMCSLTEDAKEGPRAFLEKRPAAYRDR